MKKLIIAISSLAVMGALASILLILGITSPEFVLARAVKRLSVLQSLHVSGTVRGGLARSFYLNQWDKVLPRSVDNTQPKVGAVGATFEMDVKAPFPGPDFDVQIVSGDSGAETLRMRILSLPPRIYKLYQSVPLQDRRASPGFIGEWYEFDNASLGNELFSNRLPYQPRSLDPDQESAWWQAFIDSDVLVPQGPVDSDVMAGRKVWIIPIRTSTRGRAKFYSKVIEIMTGEHHVVPVSSPDWRGSIAIDKGTFDILSAHLQNFNDSDDIHSASETIIDLSFSRHDEPLDISAPERAERIERFDPDAPPALASSGLAGTRTASEGAITAPLQPASSTATSTAAGADDDQDDDGLSDVLEQFYGSDALDPDSDRDGVMDGVEVDAGTDPIGPGLLYDFR